MKVILLSLGLMFISEVGLSCSFDTDCDIGSRCVKVGSFSMDGVCTKSPYDYTDNRPKDTARSRRYDGGDKAGESCSFNTDCGVGGQCIKTGSSLYGVCTK